MIIEKIRLLKNMNATKEIAINNKYKNKSLFQFIFFNRLKYKEIIKIPIIGNNNQTTR